ncbi:hypothetical protein DJ010_00865 [Nocardioides silvaticus]|uniref:Uncharacterized protein n=1 Tax=Nocardioides silvaticus TaxID=2201891 RepID=A0A316TKF5_9ACTN|nr:hypothetical protein [Nocardioides silvaticus]PWN04238.1 hypothetical protein DJ010_00865 [Nocardioides silvaticus]
MNKARAASAKRIAELAEDPHFEGRREDLESLSRALADASDTSWTGIDLVSAFPPEATMTSGHRHFLESFLGMLAGACVFAPVGWTWYALRSATTAYDELLAAGDERGRTFLALWTQGFDGRLAESHRLVKVAEISVVLVGIAVGFIVLHRLAAEVNVRREDRSARRAHQQLLSALLTAQRVLNERRSDDPRFLEAAVERSVKELNKAHAATRRGVESLEASSQAGLERINEAGIMLTEAVSPLLASATAAQTNLATTAAAVAAAEKEVTSSAAALHKELSSLIEHFRSAVSEQTELLTTRTSASLQSLEGAIGQVTAAQTELTQVVDAGLTAGRSAATEAADAGRRTSTELADASRRTVADLAKAVDDLRAVLDEHRLTLSGQAGTLASAADLAGQILEELRVGAARPDGLAR